MPAQNLRIQQIRKRKKAIKVSHVKTEKLPSVAGYETKMKEAVP
jgi:hypothetical protein